MSASDPMRRWVDAFPEMLEEGWAAPLPDGYLLPPGRALLFGGMGGSGMAGALAAVLLEEEGTVALPWRNARLPRWLSPEDRFVLATYSGETWEARSMLEEALDRGIPTRVVASGGSVAARAIERGVPCFLVPGGLAPRASLPWLFAGVARAVRPDLLGEIAGVARSLRAERDAPPGGRHPDEIARSLHDRLPVLLPVGRAMEAVAFRWRNQILENAEQSCIVSPLPEMIHNEVMGWPWLARGGVPAAFVVLRGSGPLPEKEKRLLAALPGEAAALGLPFLEPPPAEAGGRGALLAEVFLGDRVSVELARMRGVDATPVALIERLRKAAAKEE
ncbi:MAG: hypothetical protein FJY88_13230 [Candidatus Eisenbacteria bacterium]|nr:hypothetical protein [Candidatus Eisenbacteria bacterium]